jgi:hypothetical protein
LRFAREQGLEALGGGVCGCAASADNAMPDGMRSLLMVSCRDVDGGAVGDFGVGHGLIFRCRVELLRAEAGGCMGTKLADYAKD